VVVVAKNPSEPIKPVVVVAKNSSDDFKPPESSDDALFGEFRVE